MTEYFPSAEAMRNYTDKALKVRFDVIYGQLKEKIMTAANKGEYYIYYVDPLPKPVIEQLIKLGYDFDCEHERNEVYYVITWGQKIREDKINDYSR